MGKNSEPITEERLERAVAMLAYIVMRHGPVYAPLFDRAEQELLEYRRRHASVEDRAKLLLQNYTREGGLKAIR